MPSMLRSILASLVLVSLSSAFAQDKGFISGTFSITSRSSEAGGADGPKSTAVTVGPVLGFNLNERIVVGAGLAYSLERAEDTFLVNDGLSVYAIDRTTTTSLFTVSPFMRYMHQVNETFLLYGQAKLGVGFGQREVRSESAAVGSTKAETDLSVFDVHVGPGVVFVFSPRWAINADWGLIGYSTETEKAEVSGAELKSTESAVGFTLNPGAITFGLNWLF